jgi:hypothetical protein
MRIIVTPTQSLLLTVTPTERLPLTVMPTEVGIHVFADMGNRRRGWRACARHDAVPPPAGHPSGPLV